MLLYDWLETHLNNAEQAYNACVVAGLELDAAYQEGARNVLKLMETRFGAAIKDSGLSDKVVLK